jgi:hypothetical protein
MANITVSATLSTEEVPLLSRRIREPVIIGKYDINASKHVEDNKQQKPAETTVPMLAFAENVLATHYGYKSCATSILLDPISPTATVVFADSISTTSLGSFIYAYIEDSGIAENTGHWVAGQDENGVLSWIQLLALDAAYAAGVVITVAAVNSRIFIHVAGTITYEFDGTALAEVTLGGLTTSAIIGIFASSGYLIAYSVQKPFWSSLSDPLDFIPSDITGAGSSNVQELYGDIVLCRAAESGFIMYTTVNAVYALASTDLRFPFIFKELKGVGGIDSVQSVSYGQSQTQLVRSGANLSKVSKSGVVPAMNTINSFIRGTIIDTVDADFDINESYIGTITSQFLYTRKGEMVVSYGGEESDEFSGLVYYQDSLNRYSKLPIAHSFAVENPFQNVSIWRTIYSFGADLYSAYPEEHTYESLAGGLIRANTDTGIVLVTKTGEVKFIDGRYENTTDSILILGPFQLVREQVSTVVSVEVAAATVGEVITTIKSEASDGSVRTATPDGRQLNKSVRFDSRITGLNHLICITGSFDLSSVTLTFAPHSSRR